MPKNEDDIACEKDASIFISAANENAIASAVISSAECCYFMHMNRNRAEYVFDKNCSAMKCSKTRRFPVPLPKTNKYTLRNTV